MGEIHVFNRSAGTESEIRTLSDSKKLYISAKDLARSLSSKLYENAEQHLKNRHHLSEKNSFTFPEGQPVLSLMVEEGVEQQLLHDVNLLIMKDLE